MIVVDASVVLSWVLLDEVDRFAKFSADTVADESAIVPAIFPSELANAIVVAARRGRIDEGSVASILHDVQLLPILVESAGFAIDDEIELALTLGLSVYDSMYLTLAKREKLTLFTRDKRLAEAAGKQNIPTQFG